MELEELLGKSMDKDELEKQVMLKIKSFHGLLTREAAMRLIAKDLGLLKEEEKEYRSLNDIPQGAKRFGFSGIVKKIWPVATYSSGKRSRVIEVQDGQESTDAGSKTTASKPLILWNDDIDLARGLRARDNISVMGAYERGGELHLGYSGKLEVMKKAAFTDLSSLEDGTSVHVNGYVSRLEGDDSFVSQGRTRRGFSFMICDGKNERRCVLFERPERGIGLKEEDEVIIENGDVHKGVIEIGADSRILSRRKSAMLLGKLTRIESSRGMGSVMGEGAAEGKKGMGQMEEGMRIWIDGREDSVALDRKNALKLMDLDLANDISLDSVIILKKGQLINSRIAVRIEEKDGRVVVV